MKQLIHFLSLFYMHMNSFSIQPMQLLRKEVHTYIYIHSLQLEKYIFYHNNKYIVYLYKLGKKLTFLLFNY